MSFLVASGHVEVSAQTRDAHRDIDRLVDQMRRISPAAGDASASMNRLRDSTRETGRSVTSLNTRMRTTSDRMHNLRDDSRELDDLMRRLAGSTNGLGGALGRNGGDMNRSAGGMGQMLKVAIALSPALLPIAGALVPIAAGLGAATVAVGAFGAAIIPQIKQMSEAADAEKKYNKAVAEHGAASKQAAQAETAYLRLVSQMPAPTRQAAAALSVLKGQYKDWSNSLAGDTMPVATKAFAVFGALFPQLTPMVRGASGELNRFLTLIGGGVASPGFEHFMNQFAQFSTGALAKANDGLIRFMRSMSGSGGSALSSNVGQFMDYVRANGPMVASTLGNLSQALIHLLAAAGDVGVSMLTAVNAIAQLVNAVPTGALTAMLQLAVAIEAIKLASAGMSAIGGGLTVMATQIGVMRTAAAGATGSVGRLSAAFRALSVSARLTLAATGIGLLALALVRLSQVGRKPGPDLDRLTTSLGRLSQTGRTSGEAARVYGKDLDGLYKSIRSVSDPSGIDKFQQGLVKVLSLGFADSTPVKEAKANLDGIDKALANLVKGGHAEQAAAALEILKKKYADSGHNAGQLSKHLGDYKSALADAKFEQQLAAQSMGLFGQQAVNVQQKLDGQKRSADGLRQAIQALNDVNRAGLGGMIGFEAAIDAAAKAAQANAGALRMSHGQLNLNSEKARNAASALQDLASKTDEAAGAARDSGASWETVNGIYSRGRASLIRFAMQMGLSRGQAQQLAASILKIPDKKSTKIKMEREDAIAGLNAVIKKIKATPGSKSVTVKTLSSSAIHALEAVGFKVKRLPDGRLSVTAKTGSALSNIGAVQRARDRLSGKTITIRTNYVQVTTKLQRKISEYYKPHATGGPLRGYAAGGDVQSYPDGGYINGPGTGTSDSITALFSSGLAGRVSNTEYIVRAASVRKYGLRFMDTLNAGQLPTFKKGGLTQKQKDKIAAEKQRQKEGKSALTSDTTFTTGGRLAGYKHTETVHDLGMPDSVSSLVTSVNTYMSNIKKAFTGKTEKYLVAKLTASGKALLDNQKKLEANSKSLEDAKSNLDDLKGKFDSLKTSVSSSLVAFGNITKIGKYGTSPQTLITQLQSDTTRTSKFADELAKLKAMGLNATAISDIAQAGVTGGGMATAESLLQSSPDQIKKINDLQKQLQSAADRAGTTTADAMYGAGVRAAEGLVAGLTAKQKAIEAQMMAIAKSMEAAIKKALGIKSPSRVMEAVGSYAFQGIERGWVKRQALGKTLIAGSAAVYRPPTPATLPAPTNAHAAGSVVVHLTPTFNSMTLPSPAERRVFIRSMVKELNDELRTYQRERR